MAPKNKHLKRVYFDPKRVGSYGGANALLRVTRVPKKVVEERFGNRTHIPKPARTRFRRRRVVVVGSLQPISRIVLFDK